MIVVRIIGGMGNQLFQYAAARYFEKQFNTKVTIDISGFDKYNLRSYTLERFKIKRNYSDKKHVPYSFRIENIYLKKLFRFYENKFSSDFNIITEDIYENFVFENSKDYYFDGYWQFKDFFSVNRSKLLKEFEMNSDIDFTNSKYLSLIQNLNSISIHIRRGDYISDPKNLERFSICNLSFYERAIKYFENKLEDPVFFVFSDDIEWAKENLNIENIHFIDFNEDREENDLFLMSSCKHNIIANSTFSWWGAWLNRNSEKVVIAPKKWFNDNTQIYIPNTWLRF